MSRTLPLRPFTFPAVALALILVAPDLSAGPDEAEVKALIARLDELPFASLWDAIAKIEGLGKDAIPHIRAAISSAGEKGRLGASKAILTLGDDDARREELKRLAALASDGKDRGVRAAAIDLLASEDPEGSPALLRQIFESAINDAAVAIPAAKALWDLEQDPSARKRLLELAGSRDIKVRYAAAVALAEINYFDGPVKEVLRELRQEPSERGRLAATLLSLDRAARQDERDLDSGAAVLEGVDPKKLLLEKEKKIRELEAKVEGISRGRGAATGDPLLDEVIEKIKSSYVNKERLKPTELVLDAVKGMVRSLDDFSSFMDVREAAKFLNEIDQEYLGIGLQVSKLSADGPLEVMKPIYGGAAYQSGLRSGDRILEIDGAPTDALTQEELVEKHLKGPEGTKVKLKVLRRGWTEPREFHVDRRVIEVPSVLFDLLPEKIGYLRLMSFGKKSAEEFEAALDQLEAGGMQGLIVDLRFNPGGRLDVALRIVDFFVGERPQPMVTQKGGDEEPLSTYPTPGERPGYPIMVIINGRSASAAEVVSGALQDFHRATLIGHRSYGKGSVQKLFPLSPQVRDIYGGEMRLRLTVQYYYLPSGRCIHTQKDADGRVLPGGEGGVEPDIVVDEDHHPAWVLEELEKIRGHARIQAYLDARFGELKPLGLDGDHRDAKRWPEFDALQKELETRAPADVVRQLVRWSLRRRLEDERGKEFACDLQEDRQLQRAVIETLSRLDKDPAQIPAYSWLKPGPALEEKEPK